MMVGSDIVIGLDEKNPFLEQEVDLVKLTRAQRIRRKFADRNFSGCGTNGIRSTAVFIEILHLFSCLSIFFCSNPFGEEDPFCTPDGQKSAAAVILAITSILGIKGSQNGKTSLIGVFLLMQMAILGGLVFIAVRFMSNMINRTKQEWQLMVLMLVGICIYSVMICVVWKCWLSSYIRSSARRRSSIDEKRSMKSDFAPMTPEVRVFNPSGQTEYIMPPSPVLQFYDSMRDDGSPTIFPVYKTKFLL